MFAIVKTGGKQFKVQVGETIDVEKLDVVVGGDVRLEQVLLAANDGNIAYGRPVVEGAVVTARVVRQFKGPKLIIFKYKSKSRYRRRTGHRQNLTQLAIQAIEIPGWEPARIETKRTQAPVTAPAVVEVAPVAVEAVPVSEAEAPVANAAPVVDTREAQAWPAVEGTPAEGSAAPPGDVLPSIDPMAQVQAADAAEPAANDPMLSESAPDKPVPGDPVE